MASCVVGIAGGTASGKSTLAAALKSRLESRVRVTVISMDSFYKPEAELPLVTVPGGRTYRDYNCPEAFDWEALYATVERACSDDAGSIVVIEGLLVLWDDALRKCCDITVFADCPADVRVVRRIKRNLTWGLTVDEIADVYIDLVRYRHEQYVEPSKRYAACVYDSTDGIDHAVTDLLQRIHQ